MFSHRALAEPPTRQLAVASADTYPPALQREFERVNGLGATEPRAVVEQVERGRASRPPFISTSLYVNNHALPPSTTDTPFTRGSATVAEQTSGAWAVRHMRRYMGHFDLMGVTHLHHVADPRPDGIYAPYVRQTSKGATAALTDCPYLRSHYAHLASAGPLFASSPGRGELLYVPQYLSLKDIWSEGLSQAQIKTITELSKACTSVSSLLTLRLNEHFTVEEAIAKVAADKKQWHNGCVHLHWSIHCVSGCGQTHKFEQKRKMKRNSSGEVVDPGTVALVNSQPGPADGPKAAFLNWVIPLAKMAQAALKKLPTDYVPPVLPAVWSGLKRLQGLEGVDCSYVSFNIYWSGNLSPRLPSKCWANQHEETKLGEKHAGLYLHRDNNNDGWGAILVFGAEMRGFDQRYVTLALRLPMPGWTLVVGDFRHLLHCVTEGEGLRFSLVIANHKSTTQGVSEFGQEVYAPVGGA